MSSSSSLTLANPPASTATTSLGGGGCPFSRKPSNGYESRQEYSKPKEKDALCKAMGALFLQHRVDKLQSDVDKLETKKEASGCSWKASWKSSGCAKGRAHKVEANNAATATTSVSHNELKQVETAQHAASTYAQGQARKIIIVDVSLLIYSLRTIHNWLKEGDCRVVVPAEALRTLDLLKKGDHYINLAARKATRFLDERFVAAADTTDHNQRMAPGLVPQSEDERLSCSEQLDVAKQIDTMLSPKDIDLGQIPCTIRETMACTLYFIRKYTLSSTSSSPTPTISLGLALPPPHFDSEDLQGINVQSVKYAQRADGNALLHLARQLGLGNASSPIGDRLIVAPTASSWLTADAGGKGAIKQNYTTQADAYV